MGRFGDCGPGGTWPSSQTAMWLWMVLGVTERESAYWLELRLGRASCTTARAPTLLHLDWEESRNCHTATACEVWPSALNVIWPKEVPKGKAGRHIEFRGQCWKLWYDGVIPKITVLLKLLKYKGFWTVVTQNTAGFYCGIWGVWCCCT